MPPHRVPPRPLRPLRLPACLPQGAREDKTKAEYTDGVLTITVPLAAATEKPPATRVEIRRAE